METQTKIHRSKTNQLLNDLLILKTKINMKNLTFIFGILLVISGCDSPSDTAQSINTSTDSIVNTKPTLSDAELKGIMESIPSPLELSSLIQNSGARYTESYLNKTENLNKYNSQFSKALSLGIYGADLGYINLYNKTYSAMSYLNSVYQLATDLKIGDYFDFNTLKRLAVNNKNLDSIVYITTSDFEKMHKQLKQENNSQLSALILIGGWAEGVYLTTEIIQSSDSPQTNELMLTVKDEGLVVDELIKLADAYKNHSGFTDLVADLNTVKKAFDNTNTNDTTITKAQFNPLAKEIIALRNKLIQ